MEGPSLAFEFPSRSRTPVSPKNGLPALDQSEFLSRGGGASHGTATPWRFPRNRRRRGKSRRRSRGENRKLSGWSGWSAPAKKERNRYTGCGGSKDFVRTLFFLRPKQQQLVYGIIWVVWLQGVFFVYLDNHLSGTKSHGVPGLTFWSCIRCNFVQIARTFLEATDVSS